MQRDAILLQIERFAHGPGERPLIFSDLDTGHAGKIPA